MSMHNDGYAGHSKDTDELKNRDIEGYGGKKNDTKQQYYSGEGQYISNEDQHVHEFEDTDENQNNSEESFDFELHTDSEVSSFDNFFERSKHVEIRGGMFNYSAGPVSYGNEHTSSSAPVKDQPRPSNPRGTSFFSNASHSEIAGGNFRIVSGDAYAHPPSQFRLEAPPPRSGMRGRQGEDWAPPRAGHPYAARTAERPSGFRQRKGGPPKRSNKPGRTIPSPTPEVLDPGFMNPYFPNLYPAILDRRGRESDGTRQDNDSSPLKLVDKIVPDHRQRLDSYLESYLNSPLAHPREKDALKPKQVQGEFEIVTCWIAAEKALRHIQNNRPQIDSEFLKRNIQKSQYTVLAGFDESLIEDGIGYLEQVHIFTSADVAANSTLLADLGRILSPFPSILFTESSYPHLLPVFKPDGTAWELDKFLLETASKIVDHGSTEAMYPAITSLSQTSSGTTSGSTSSGSQENYGPDNEKAGDNTENEGDNNAGKGEQQGDKKGKGREENPDDPDDPGEPDGQPEGQSSGSVRFEVPSKLCLNYNSSHFQLLNVVGDLKIQLERHAGTAKCRVLFTTLDFTSIRATLGTVYGQFFVRVALDSQDQRDRAKIIKPLQTLTNERSRKVVVGEKSSWSILGSIATTISALPTKLQAVLTATGGRSGETFTSAEQVENTFRVKPQSLLSRASCAFYISDPTHREDGIQMTDDMLPTVDFELFQDATSPRVSRSIDVEIKSYWSAISRRKEGSLWLNSVALKIPSNLTERVFYTAERVVDLQNLNSKRHPPPIADSPLVTVTPRVSSSRYSDLASVNTGM